MTADSLQTKRLVMRPPLPRDWPAFETFMLSDRAAAFGSQGDLGKSWRSFASELGHWQIYGYGMWAVTQRGDDTTCLGLVGPWTPPDWPETEIGWMIFDPATEGTGIAHEAAQAALTHAFDVLGWTTAVSYVAPGNDRSSALATRLGATLDPAAIGPTPDTQVFRHPRPEARK